MTNETFTKINNELLDRAILELNESELKIYLVLCKHSFGNKTECYPAQKTIQEMTNLTQASVSRALKKLAEKNFISIQKHKNHSGFANNVYHINSIDEYNRLNNIEAKKEEKKEVVVMKKKTMKMSKFNSEIYKHTYSKKIINTTCPGWIMVTPKNEEPKVEIKKNYENYKKDNRTSEAPKTQDELDITEDITKINTSKLRNHLSLASDEFVKSFDEKYANYINAVQNEIDSRGEEF